MHFIGLTIMTNTSVTVYPHFLRISNRIHYGHTIPIKMNTGDIFITGYPEFLERAINRMYFQLYVDQNIDF